MGTIKTKRPVKDDGSMTVFFGTTTTDGLAFDKGTSYDDWAMAGLKIRHMKDFANFAFGDWLNHGEATYGELYAQAADETGYRLESLQTFQRVSRAVPESIRRIDKLTYGHHVLVAAHRYPLEQKVRWLKRAIDEEWNVREMRAAMIKGKV